MASEYLKWKYRDVKPETPRILTPKERRANWWYYHKWYVLGGIILVPILVNIVCRMLGIGVTEPDVQIAYVGSRLLPDDTIHALETALSTLSADQNGDGNVIIHVEQYMTLADPEDQETAMYAYASATRLMADMQSGESGFFLLEDPETFQRNYEILAERDGEILCLRWSDCPVLVSLPLGNYAETMWDTTVSGENQSLLEPLYLTRSESRTGSDAYDTLWTRLTEGAFS